MFKISPYGVSSDLRLGIIRKTWPNTEITFALVDLRSKKVIHRFDYRRPVKQHMGHNSNRFCAIQNKPLKNMPDAAFSPCGNYVLLGTKRDLASPTQYTQMFCCHTGKEIGRTNDDDSNLNIAFANNGALLLRRQPNSENLFSLLRLTLNEGDENKLNGVQIAILTADLSPDNAGQSITIKQAFYSQGNKYLFVTFSNRKTMIVDTDSGKIIEKFNSLHSKLILSETGNYYLLKRLVKQNENKQAQWKLGTDSGSQELKIAHNEKIIALLPGLVIGHEHNNEIIIHDIAGKQKIIKEHETSPQPWNLKRKTLDCTLTKAILSHNGKYLVAFYEVPYRIIPYHPSTWYEMVVYDMTNNWKKVFYRTDFANCRFSPDDKYLFLYRTRIDNQPAQVSIFTTADWSKSDSHRLHDWFGKIGILEFNTEMGQFVLSSRFQTRVLDYEAGSESEPAKTKIEDTYKTPTLHI